MSDLRAELLQLLDQHDPEQLPQVVGLLVEVAMVAFVKANTPPSYISIEQASRRFAGIPADTIRRWSRRRGCTWAIRPDRSNFVLVDEARFRAFLNGPKGARARKTDQLRAQRRAKTRTAAPEASRRAG